MQASYDHSHRQRSRSGPTGALASPLYNASIPLPIQATPTIGAIHPSLIPGNINGVRPTSSYNGPAYGQGSMLPPGAMIPSPARRRDYSSPPGRPSTHYASPARGATSPPLPVKPTAYQSWSNHTPISSPPLPPKVPSLPGQSPALSFYNTAVATASPGSYMTAFAPMPLLHVPEDALRVPSPLPSRLPTPGPPQMRHEPSLSRPSTPPATYAPIVRPIPISVAFSAVASPAIATAAPLVDEPDPYDEQVMRRAMEVSMREQASTQDLASREEEELAKAIEASMRLDSPPHPDKSSTSIASSSQSSLYSRPPPIAPTASPQINPQGPRPLLHPTTTRVSNSSASSSSSSSSTPSYGQESLAPQSASTISASPREYPTPPLEVPQSAPAATRKAQSEYPFPQTDISLSRTDQMAADEALARRLALEEDTSSQDTAHSSTSTTSSTHSPTIQAVRSQPQSHTSSPRQETLTAKRRAHSTSDLPSAGPNLVSTSSRHPTVIEEDMPTASITAPRTANQFVEPGLLMGLCAYYPPYSLPCSPRY